MKCHKRMGQWVLSFLSKQKANNVPGILQGEMERRVSQQLHPHARKNTPHTHAHTHTCTHTSMLTHTLSHPYKQLRAVDLEC